MVVLCNDTNVLTQYQIIMITICLLKKFSMVYYGMKPTATVSFMLESQDMTNPSIQQII